MPMHDWTRVPAGIYHDFHNAWITELRSSFNAGLLPPDYYALGEQRAGDVGPDVLTLHAEQDDDATDTVDTYSVNGGSGMIAVAQSPPKVRISQEAAEDAAFYLSRQRAIVIRHVSGDRVIAVLEIVSPANKHSRRTLDDFVDKAVDSLREGIHLVIIDPFPPTRNDPSGMHAAVWERLMAGRYDPPADLPLTLVSYCARHPITAYIEPIRVGNELVDMPLFLTTAHYVPAPLEMTYMQAWSGVPQRWRRVIEH